MRIGILGGTFDPLHRGHAALARAALKELRLDRLYFLPAKRSPFKSGGESASGSHRAGMIRSLLPSLPHCRLSLLEFRRPGVSYTVDSLKWFRRRYPQDEIFFVMGDDCLAGFRRWKNWRSIPKLAALVIGRRGGKKAAELKALYLKSKMPHISSTEIRERMQRSRPWLSGVPAAVARYIKRRRLYGIS